MRIELDLPDQETCNADRAKVIQSLLEAYGDGNGPESDLTDLLTNCLHFCQMNNLNLDDIIANAKEHHVAEYGREFMPVLVSDQTMEDGASKETLRALVPACLPAEHSAKHSRFRQLIRQVFYQGCDTGAWRTKDGIDRDEAMRHFKALLRSRQIDHYQKLNACAFLMDLWFEPDSLIYTTA